MKVSTKEITSINEIEKILNEAQVCRIALFDKEYPYIVPLCYGYMLDGDKLELYFHCSPRGKKMELIKKNNSAAFEIDSLDKIVAGEIACGFTAIYKSITGNGSIEVINGIEKLIGLNSIMKKYDGGKEEYKYSEKVLNNVVILKLTAESFCCKTHTDNP